MISSARQWSGLASRWVPLDRIEDIAAGCVNVAHEGMGDIARWAALAAGFPDSVPAATVTPLECRHSD